jgi:hypothetical protein
VGARRTGAPSLNPTGADGAAPSTGRAVAVPGIGGRPAQARCTHTDFRRVNDSSECSAISRPQPLCLMPPNGLAKS